MLNEKGIRAIEAIDAGIAAMTPERWAEEAENAAQWDDSGEWFASEFAAARQATEGISWDFASWRGTRDYIDSGRGVFAYFHVVEE